MNFNIRKPTRKKFPIFLLIMLFLILIVNEFSIKLAFSNVIIGRCEFIVIRLFEIVLIFNIIFFSIVKKGSKIYKLVVRILFNLLTVLVSITIIFAIFEVILNTGLFDGLDNPSPVWIPAKYTQMNDDINKKNFEYSLNNPFRFTDRPRSFQSPHGVKKRIAVIGDSFVWGYGIPYDSAWNHKLEKLVVKHDSTVELMSFGKSSWSTQDEFDFLKDHLDDFENISLIIFSYVTNDPCGTIILQKNLFGIETGFNKHIDERNLDKRTKKNLKLLSEESIKIDFCKHIFPNSLSFLGAYIKQFLTNSIYTDRGYFNWERLLYEEENLKAYELLLNDLHDYLKKRNIDLLFVMIPSTPVREYVEPKFEAVKPLFDAAGIKYYDLLPQTLSEFEGINPRTLWANPADSHPGDSLTTFYANLVYEHLVENNYLDPNSVESGD